MKAILEFDLNDTFEVNAFRRANSATNAYLVMFDLNEKLRSLYKYENKENIKISEVREMLVDLQTEYNINMNDLE